MKRLLLRTKIGSLFFLASLLLAMLAGAPPPTALAFTYSESVSGDLPQSLPAGSVFPFDVGANTVSGSFSGSAIALDLDSLAFSVPAGSQLESVSFAFSTTGSTDLTGAFANFLLCPGNAFCFSDNLASVTVDLLGASPVSAFGSGLPLDPGTFGIFELTPSWTGTSFTTDYTWTFTVEPTAIAPVPEPTTMLLLGSGLLALWGAKKKFKK